MESDIFRADICQITSSPSIPWQEFENATILITGATGLIGSAIVHALSAASDRYGLGMRIIAHGRNAAKGAALSENCGVEFINGDIRNALTSVELTADKLDYTFHCAAITRSADMVARPIDVITTAVKGTQNVLELARNKRSKSVVYLSSMEIYGQTKLKEVRESDLGYLDLTSPRSSYPESKRLCESLCAAYLAQYGVPVKIARLAQTFGAGTPKDDPRVFAQFARSASAGENIVLHTEGKSQGNYCYISDVVSGLILLLLKGKNGEAYNLSNPDASVTIYEMAELVAGEVSGGKLSAIIDVPSDIAERGYAQNIGYRLNVDKMKSLGWTTKYGLVEMYRRMIADWQENVYGN